MIHTPTLFIVGAGASQAYGLPTGGKLLFDLKHNDWPHGNAVNIYMDNQTILNKQSFDRFRESLKESGVNSIDDYLETHESQRLIGKFHIAHQLVQAESRVKLFEAPGDQDWLQVLWDAMKSPADQFAKNQVGFIIYNYDRCIEHYLTTVLDNRWNIGTLEAWKQVSQLRFVHPHGILGNYVPLGHQGVIPGRHFGCESFAKRSPDFFFQEVREATAGIRVYSEPQPADSDTKTKVHNLLSWAKKIVFLGYGFNKYNNAHFAAQIVGSNTFSSFQTFHATGSGLRTGDLARVRKHFNGIIKPQPLTCYDLMKELPLGDWSDIDDLPN